MRVPRPKRLVQNRLEVTPEVALVLGVQAAQCGLSLAAYLRMVCDRLVASGGVTHEQVKDDVAKMMAKREAAKPVAAPKRPRGRPRKTVQEQAAGQPG